MKSPWQSTFSSLIEADLVLDYELDLVVDCQVDLVVDYEVKIEFTVKLTW